MMRRITQTRTPLLQMMYVSIVYAMFSVFHTHAFPLLSFATQISAWCSTAAVALIFLAASLADPGVITSDTLQNFQGIYEQDALFPPVGACEPCGLLQRPPRSKHCHVCGHCVHRFDHHCHFTNTCIGHSNAKYFHMFLMATSLCTYYCSFLCFHLIRKHGIPVFGGSPLSILGTFSFLGGTSVFAYAMYHLYLVYHGYTMNEWVKRRRARQAYELRVSRGQPVPSESLLRNPYDKGPAENFRAVFFPQLN